MPDKLRRVPLTLEVHAFEAEVGRDQGFVVGRNAQHGAVVAHTGDNSCASPAVDGTICSQGAYARNESSFSKGHGNDDMQSFPACQPDFHHLCGVPLCKFVSFVVGFLLSPKSRIRASELCIYNEEMPTSQNSSL